MPTSLNGSQHDRPQLTELLLWLHRASPEEIARADAEKIARAKGYDVEHVRGYLRLEGGRH